MVKRLRLDLLTCLFWYSPAMTNPDLLFAEQILFCVFVGTASIQVLYFLVIYSRLAFHKTAKKNGTEQPVSVVICARNELRNIRTNLQPVVEQEHKNLQVVVVNDCSWDESQKALEEYEDAYSHLKVMNLVEQERYRHGKKFALSLGIKGALNETVLLTDADCRPASPHWVSEMTKNISGNKQIVIGYGAYEKKKGFLNKWIRFDTVFNAIQYLSYAIMGNTYMGTGRNLAYTKSLFFKNKGFAKHNHILSGDDDLFINEVANGENVAVELNHGSFTYSVPKEKFGEWFKQKKRHMSSSGQYRFRHKFLLGLFYTSQILFYAALITLLVLRFDIRLIGIVFGTRLFIQMIIYGLCMRNLRELDLLIFTPLFDIFIVLIYPILAISNLFIKNKVWK